MARNAYLDEAGISHPSQEPHLVVAGVILHVDTQWRALHEHFQGLIQEFVPPEHQEGFIFHAKDIWHGEGAVFDRAKWIERWGTRDRRDVLHALCDTVIKFSLPIAWGDISRQSVADALKEERDSFDSNSVTRVAFMCAFADCAIRAEQWMKKYGAAECLSLVIESNDQLKKFATGTYRELRKDPCALQRYIDFQPIRHIIDAPSFMEKQDAPPLQLADTCAFILKRYWGGRGDVVEFVVKLLPSMFYAFDQGKLAALEARLKSQSEQRKS